MPASATAALIPPRAVACRANSVVSGVLETSFQYPHLVVNILHLEPFAARLIAEFFRPLPVLVQLTTNRQQRDAEFVRRPELRGNLPVQCVQDD